MDSLPLFLCPTPQRTVAALAASELLGHYFPRFGRKCLISHSFSTSFDWRQGWALGFEPWAPFILRVPGGCRPLSVLLRDPPPGWAEPGRMGSLREVTAQSLLTHSDLWFLELPTFPRVPSGIYFSVLSVFRLFMRVSGKAERAAALESKGESAQFFSFFPPQPLT